MNELDKFKRRLVRSVVHILKLDREPQEAAWEQMRAKTGCDCRLLWERMRALTMKKMKRLVAADDRNENIAAIARLSRTDWLVFDLVLVHEKFDVIGRDQISRAKGKTEQSIMEELFELVHEYNIERLAGTPLLAAWSALTRHYNSKLVVTIDKRTGTCSTGRHSSPMLLQRRWYQLKEATRANFYKLWNSYRGNQRLWSVARAAAPTPLQAEIAKRYPQVITQPFPEWEELIQQKKVFLAEQFEMHNRIKNRPNSDDKPDLVVIEPVIDTIDLGEESDGEASTSVPGAEQVHMARVKQEPADDCLEIKEEPLEDGLSNVQITEATHVPDDMNEDSNSRCSLGFSEANTKNLTAQMSMETSTIDDPSVSQSAEEETPGIELPDDLIKQKAEEYLKRKSVTLKPEIETQIVDEDKNDDIVDDIIKQKADDFVRKVDMKKLVSDVVDDLKVNSVAEEASLPADMTFDDEGIEFVDDGIEFVEDDDDSAEKKTQDDARDPVIKTEKDETNVNKSVENDEEEENNKKNKNIEEDTVEESELTTFDLKLLMEPVVYTTKLDDMIVFKGKKIDFVQYQNVIESVIVESKPVSKRAINLETQDDDDSHSQSNVSQCSKTASDDLFTNDTISQFKLNQTKDKLPNNDSLKKISEAENNDAVVNDDSRPATASHVNDVVASVINDAINKYRLQQTKDTVLNDDLLNKNSDLINKDACSRHSSNSNYESEVEIDESLKVKETSYLLQKPRSRSYNPIILCKNPDFNTRLKRLTAGFFSSERNRKLLSACKPMTIDVHKAFEDKLVNGTIYLKSSKGTPKPIKVETDTAASSSVMPSAMPIQSLLSKEKSNINIEDLMASTQIDTVDLTSRSKTINLKNISEIRRINQNLLTAQVPPMQHGTVEIVDGTAKRDDEEPRVIHIHEGQRSMSGPVPVEPEESKMNDIAMSYSGGVRGRGRGRGWRGVSSGVPRGAGRGQLSRKITLVSKPPLVSEPIYAPWRLGPKLKPTNIDDFLITIDTLNRMINKLDGNEEFRDPQRKKNRRPNWTIEKHLRESLGNNDLVDSNSNDTTTPVEVDDTGSRNAINTCTLVLDATVPEAAVNVSVKTAETVEETGEKSTKAVKKNKKKPKKKYCCWCREKFLKLSTNASTTLHKCNNIQYDERGNLILCQCCCRQILLKEMKRIKRNFDLRANKTTTESVEAGVDTSMGGPIVLSDEEIRNSNSEDSNDVRIPGFDPEDEIPPVPKVRVTEYPSKPGESIRVVRGTPIKVAAVTSQVSASVNTQSSPPLSMVAGTQSQQQPVLRINVNFTPAPPDTAPTAPSLIPSINTGTSLPQIPLLQHVEENARPMPAIAAARTQKKVTIPVPPLHPFIKTSHRQIVIDASGSCPRIATQATDDRVFFLNSKTLSKKPKESPIFLGKNKILLTTVKFPKELDTPISTPPVVQPSNVVPTLPLPTGVQLVLMPDGQLGYSVDPSVQLDESQLAILPKILSAVQEQINISNQMTAPLAAQTSSVSSITSMTENSVFGSNDTIESVSQEIVAVQSISLATESVSETTESLSKTTESASKTTESASKTTESASKTTESASKTTESASKTTQLVAETTQSVTEKTQPLLEVTENVKGTENQNQNASLNSNEMIEPFVIPNDSENENSGENDLNMNTTEELTADSTNNINSSKDSEIITIEETDNSTDANVSSTNACLNTSNVETEGASGSRNLLSDLMEMSGISSDDAKTQSATQIAMPVEGNPSISLVATPGETTEATLAGLTVGHVKSTAPYNETVEISETDKKQLLTELSPISSLAQLKYACDNNGLFYKLDLDTGVLAPINVCIKKNLKPKAKVNKRVSTPVVKSVIDLTDDLEIEPAKNVSKDGTIKPIKLVKRIEYPGVVPSILRKQRENLVLAAEAANANNAVGKFNVRVIRKRKQNFGKIEVKIDLVDSDAPMEEEYLVDSSDSEKELPKSVASSAYQSDDSSDEEPLAKKFMRLKQKNMKSAPATAENNDSPVEVNCTNDPKDNNVKNNTLQVQKDIDCSMEAPVPIGSPKPAELAAEKVADTDDMDIEEPQFMSFLADENESPEEDCILGV